MRGRTLRLLACTLLAALLGFAVPSFAQGAGERQIARADDGVVLNAGEYLWYADLDQAQPGGVNVVISIPSQLAYIYRDGALIGVSTVSTGRPGKETPIGSFTILEKQVFHRSNKYSNAPMPFMQRLTWDGIAMHAGPLPGYPASHGCIRFPAAFARALYGLTAVGATVTIVDTQLADPTLDPRGTRSVPVLRVETASLGGEAFNVVTSPGAPPVVATPVTLTRDGRQVRFAPPEPVVQPLPGR